MGEEAGGWAWGQGQASLSKLLGTSSVCLPRTKTRVVQVCSFPSPPFFIFIFIFFQEKQHRFEGDGEFNLVYENL